MSEKEHTKDIEEPAESTETEATDNDSTTESDVVESSETSVVEADDKPAEPSKPEPEQAASKDRKPEHEPKPAKPGRAAAALAFLSLLVAVGAVAGCAYLYYQLDLLNKAASRRSDEQLTQIQALDKSAELAELSDRIAQVEENSQTGDGALAETMGQLESAVRVLQENGARTDRDWAIAETRYLLKMAQRRLVLAGDLDTAAAATRAADEQLHALADIRLLPVREALAEEIAVLRSTPKPDIEGNVFALIQLARRSNELPLKPRVTVVDLQETDDGSVELAEAEPAQPVGFRESMMQFVDRFVVVKSVGVSDSDVFPLSADGGEVLGKRAALQVALQQAQIAVLRRDQSDYKDALDEAGTMLRTHFDGNSEVVRRFAEDLALLEQSPVRPTLSTVGGGLELLNKIVAEWEAES